MCCSVEIDVDGFEVEVLRGASKILATCTDCYVEVHVGIGLEEAGGSAEQVLAFFPADRFDLLVSAADEDKVEPLALNARVLSGTFFSSRWRRPDAYSIGQELKLERARLLEVARWAEYWE